MDKDNTALVRRFIVEVLFGSDIGAADTLLADDFISHGPGPFECDRQGLAYFVEFLEGMRHATGRTGAVTIEAIAGEGDTVMVWTSSEYQIPVQRYMPQELLEIMRQAEASTGIRVQDQVQSMGVVIFRVVDGKIAEQWLFTSYPLALPPSRPRPARAG
jgi:predicted SnoaL-like aldol condensation-catalyzing enzyme